MSSSAEFTHVHFAPLSTMLGTLARHGVLTSFNEAILESMPSPLDWEDYDEATVAMEAYNYRLQISQSEHLVMPLVVNVSGSDDVVLTKVDAETLKEVVIDTPLQKVVARATVIAKDGYYNADYAHPFTEQQARIVLQQSALLERLGIQATRSL